MSILIGSIGGLYQYKIKRLLAYSAIANIGYIVLGFRILSFNGYIASLYYLFIYILMSINIFSIVLSIKRYPYFLEIKNIVEFVSITHSNFILSLLLVLCLFSLAGIPPLFGLFGKFFIFISLIEQDYFLLALSVLCSSVLMAVYYIR
jgi:NADH-quinone oxidoreductase subunit N